MESVTELLVVFLGIVTSLVMVVLRRITTLVDKAPKVVRTLIVVALATPVAMLSGWLGVDLPGDPMVWDGAVINVILTALTAMGAHAGAKALQK